MSKPGLKKKNVLHKRFFVLDQHYLHYFKADKDVTPLNSIPLEGCSVFSKSSRKLPIFHILHPNRRTFIICANSHEEKEKWVYAINCVICSLSTDAINPIKGNTSSVLTLAFVLENLLALRASSYRWWGSPFLRACVLHAVRYSCYCWKNKCCTISFAHLEWLWCCCQVRTSKVNGE